MVANNQQLSRSQSASNQQALKDFLGSSRGCKVGTVNKQIKTDFNAYVLDIIKTYDIKNISYPYLLNNDYTNYNGVTTNLVFKAKLLLRPTPVKSGSHCVDITFEVFLRLCKLAIRL